MLNVIFTLDYEIHGNGDGDPHCLMVEPTARMLDQFDAFGAKLTILADVAEILRFRDHRQLTGRDDFHYQAIADQLVGAVRRGHDVQLHLHPGFFNARLEQDRWRQDWSEYNFATLPFERMSSMLQQGKAFLEKLLRAINPNYRCVIFRAANWAAQPSRNLVRALVQHGFQIDTSVFKYGSRQGLVEFNYAHAPDNMKPWPADEEDICRTNPSSRLWEYPIYCEKRWLGAFATPMRCYRALLGRFHQVPSEYFDGQVRPRRASRLARACSTLFGMHAWKADFNQCTGSQLIGALQRASAQDQQSANPLPFILIGHSKLFTRGNERSVRPFLRHVAKTPTQAQFTTFAPFL